MKNNVTLKNIFYYFQGHLRYKLYYSRFKFLVRKHIREQYEYRIGVMDRECYWNGYCKICGCKTTHLQFADKPCEGNCYPKMLNKKDWNEKLQK